MLAVAANIAAMNVQRQYNISTDRQRKTNEKLSSGYRINRAADDAAGLSISEKMRKQMRGLDRGTTNAQDGISLLQIADGSLAEMTEMMHRMTELSIQSANGTYSDSDRQAMQDEIKQLQLEINGEVERTRFNDKPIFPEAFDDPVPEDDSLPDVKIGNVTGTPTDSTISEYKFSADEKGITINGETTNTIPWSSIKDSDGRSIDSLQEGTYSFDYNGLTFPVTTPEVSSVKSLSNILSTYTVSRVSVPDRPLTQAVSTASFSATGAAIAKISAGTTYSIPVTDTGINGKNWADIAPGLEKDGDLGKDSVQTSIDLGDGISLNLTIQNGATRDAVKKALSGLSVTVREGNDLRITTKDTPTIDTSKPYPSVMFRADDSYNKSDWTLKSNPLGDDALKDLAKAVGCDPDQLSDIKLMVNFSNTKNGKNAPIATLYAKGKDADGNSLSQKSIVYTMTDKDLTSFKAALNDGKPHAENEVVADATFTYKGSTYTAHLPATKALTGTNDSPAPDAILDKGKYPGNLYRVNVTSEKKKELVTSGSLASQESGNVTHPPYHDKYQVSSTLEGKDERSYPKRSWWIQSGADTMAGQVVSVGKISLRLLGLDDMDISTQKGAYKGIDKAARALDYISKVRSDIGAQQNRLEHTIANNDNAVENTTASESRIRDMDMAEAMVDFHKNNILELVGESMLAQANNQQKDVVNLLQQ